MSDTGDALSDVLRMVHLKACIYFVKNMPAPWGMDIPASGNGPLHMVLDGTCLLRCGETQMSLKTGDAVLLPHGAQHQMLDKPDTTPEPGPQVMDRLMKERSNPNHEYATKMLCGHFEWDAAFDHPFFRELPELIVIRNIFDQPDASRIHAIVNLIADESSDQRPGGSAIADRMGEALFVSLLRNWMIDQRTDASLLATLNDPKLSRALRHMHLNPQQDLDLNKLASVAGMSRTAFAIRFREVLGTPPAAYLTDWRMMTARRLLINTQLTTADITERIGYSSDSSFTRAFKRRFGQTPGSVRRNLSAVQ